LPLDDGYVDIVPFRAETLEADLAARDFTVNAMAVRLRDLPSECLRASGPADVVDPTGGQVDLRAGRLRFATARAPEDHPLRVLRAVRLACELSMRIEPVSAARLAGARAGLEAVAAERAGAELERTFQTPRAARGARLL